MAFLANRLPKLNPRPEMINRTSSNMTLQQEKEEEEGLEDFF